ncbi:hypothetical protein PROFUN_16900, partial [Planoprotostelium fungivorum]
WYQTPTVSDDIANFWESIPTCFPDQHEDVPYQVGRPPGELLSRPLWSVYTSEMEQNNRPMYIAYEDIDNQWTLGKIIKFCNRNGYKVQQMIFADPQWRLLNCYEIVFPQRVIHQDVKFKRNQTGLFKAPSKRRGLVHTLSKLPIFVNPLPCYQELLNCYEIVFPQRVIHQDVKFKRNQTVKKSSMDEISLAHSNFTKN